MGYITLQLVWLWNRRVTVLLFRLDLNFETLVKQVHKV